MNTQEIITLIVTAVVYAILNKVTTGKLVFKTGNSIIDKLTKKNDDKFIEEEKERLKLERELHNLKASNILLIRFKLSALEQELEVTNDADRKAEILNEIELLTKVGE